MQNWFNNNEISAQNREALEIFNEAARIGMDYSVRLWEKQAEAVRAAADRNLARAASSAGAAFTPESAAKFGKEAGEAEVAEFQRAAREFCDIAAEAGEALLGVAEKGRGALARNFGEAAAKGAASLPNGQGAATADMVRQTAATANEMFANGIQFACKAMQTGMDGMKESPAFGGDGNGAAFAAKAAAEKSRGGKRARA